MFIACWARGAVDAELWAIDMQEPDQIISAKSAQVCKREYVIDIGMIPYCN